MLTDIVVMHFIRENNQKIYGFNILFLQLMKY